ncbi:hypothetical protein PR202_gb24059 [Eleusine coracana subsp. coracana]|uniref:Uncharacterized protein n=1 Tax=Eleusine coracana subsp. coracana TaxID=191504 RepID=A0AAV5FHS1_ELECO|nr:hypothetical protein PR202_gb24059 [Eleusine coracana subsp. coracana]
MATPAGAGAVAAPSPADEEARALLPSSTPYDDEDLEERAYEAADKVIVSISDGPDPDEDDGDAALRSSTASGTPPFSWRKLWLYTGPGFLMSIAFLDPGNLEGDLQAGAVAGDTLLWLLLWATAMGLLVQLLAARLGVATGRHLAELCRDEYPDAARRALWLMTEVAMVGADIQEVIGSAIAIKILSRGYLPLWAGVVITALDCFIFLSLENYGVRKLEAVFAFLIATMAISFAWMFTDTKPNGKDLLVALVQSRKIDQNKEYQVREALRYYSIESTVALAVSFMINLFVTTVFAKGFYGSKVAGNIGLENAGQYLQEKFGGGGFPILYIWGIGLLAAGQSSTITGTYAGQFIMGGFLNLRLKKWIRALITRSFAIVPTIIVALYFDASDSALDVLNEWLNVLQSIQIPFALIPLITLVSKEEVMGVFKIGPNTQAVTWTVATLLITINGYLLMDFFSKEIRGPLSGSLLCLVVLIYASFVLYLILRGPSVAERNCKAAAAWMNSIYWRCRKRQLRLRRRPEIESIFSFSPSPHPQVGLLIVEEPSAQTNPLCFEQSRHAQADRDSNPGRRLAKRMRDCASLMVMVASSSLTVAHGAWMVVCDHCALCGAGQFVLKTVYGQDTLVLNWISSFTDNGLQRSQRSSAIGSSHSRPSPTSHQRSSASPSRLAASAKGFSRMSTRIRKHASGNEKRKKKKRMEEEKASQSGAIHKFFKSTVRPYRRNNEELAIVVWEQQTDRPSQENPDVNENNGTVSDHENASADEQPFFSFDIYDLRN